MNHFPHARRRLARRRTAIRLYRLEQAMACYMGLYHRGQALINDPLRFLITPGTPTPFAPFSFSVPAQP